MQHAGSRLRVTASLGTTSGTEQLRMPLRIEMPADDLLSALVQIEHDGDRLSTDELLSTAQLLLVAGHETTVNLIANAVLAMLRHPHHWAALSQDSGRAPAIVEETLRQLGLVDNAGQVTLTIEKPGQGTYPVKVAFAAPGQPFPLVPFTAPGFAAAINIPTPLFLSRPLERFYWAEYLPEKNTVYVQYAQCAENPQQPFDAFTTEVLALVDAHPACRVVLDLRGNGGGDSRVIKGDAAVVALGSYSRPLLAKHGVSLNIYPAKGYSATLNLKRPELASTVSLLDDTRKLAISRLGNQVRIAGTAELSGFDTSLDGSVAKARCAALLRRYEELFPGAADLSEPNFWTGLRPSTPTNIPYIGSSRIKGLWLNTGHGTLGWTHGAGSGLAMAQLISGQRPELEFGFCSRA